MFAIRPEHSRAIAVINTLAVQYNTAYHLGKIRFGFSLHSRNGSVYVEITQKGVLHYTTTCAEARNLLEAFFGPHTDKDCKGYVRWTFQLLPGVHNRVKLRLQQIYQEMLT